MNINMGMNLEELEERLESLESAHEGHREMKAAIGASLGRLAALRKQAAAYAAFGVEPLKVQLPAILQANIAACKARALWAELEQLAGIAPYNAAIAKVNKLTLMVAGAGKSRVLRRESEANAIYAGSLTSARQAYREALRLCWKLRKGKRTLKGRSVIDHNAFIAWETLRVGLQQVKRLLAMKSDSLAVQRRQDKHYAALQQWAYAQGIALSKVANPSSQWEEAGRLNGRVYVIHNALEDTPISKGEIAKTKVGVSLPIVPATLDELRHGLPHREVRVVVKGKPGMQRTIRVNRL